MGVCITVWRVWRQVGRGSEGGGEGVRERVKRRGFRGVKERGREQDWMQVRREVRRREDFSEAWFGVLVLVLLLLSLLLLL